MKNYSYNPRSNSNIKQRYSSILINQVVTIILAICLLFCAAAYITRKTYYTAEVVGASMYPTINAEQKITGINDVAFYTLKKGYKKGDIIIVDYSNTGDDIDAIKRLIAVGGDTVCYYNGSILVNGVALSEPYMIEAYNKIENNPEILEGSTFSSAEEWKTEGFSKSKERFEKWCRILLDPFKTQAQKDAELQD